MNLKSLIKCLFKRKLAPLFTEHNILELNMNNLMTAVKIHAYGGRDQLQRENVAIPILGVNDVLVKIHAAAVNPIDCKVREGVFAGMFQHQLPLTLGWDFSGEIVELGSQVKNWKLGDAVYALSDVARDGTYAEYIAVAANDIAHKPSSASWTQAAAVPLVTLTAWQALYDIAKLQGEQKVLIHAGAGGVGIAAIQLAKLRGAYVYTTASARNGDFLRELGADVVIDYNQEDFSTTRDLDVVFDTMGGEVQKLSWQTLKKGGCMVSVVSPPDAEQADKHSASAEFCFVQRSADQLNAIASLIDENKLKIEIDSVYHLDEVVGAHEKSEAGHTRGKIIIQIVEENI